MTRQQLVRFNDTKGLKKYLDEHADEMSGYVDEVSYDYDLKLNIFDGDRKVNPVDGSVDNDLVALLASSSSDKEITEGDLIKTSFKEIVSTKPYDLLSGRLPEKSSDLLLVVDSENELPLSVAYALNLASRDELDAIIDELNRGEIHQFNSEVFKYDDVIGHTYQVKFGDGTTEDLSVVGVAKVKKSGDASQFMGYTHDLIERAVRHSAGAYDIDNPAAISIYAKSEDDKEKVSSLIDDYNKSTGANIYYVDQTKAMVGAIKQVINILSAVLIAFVAISLIVSSIMIGIITYISVLERTKEIGILRAIGASKRDVIRVFTAETIIEGFVAGLIGVVVAALLCFLANAVISGLAHIDDLTQFSIVQALILIAISVILTVIAGYSPARRASKKDPVEALRGE